MAKKTPPCEQYPVWTTAKFWSFVRSGLRAKWTRWPPKYEILAEAKRNVPKNKKVRHRYEYQCASCKKFFPQKHVEVDHIEPVGSLRCYDDLPAFVERLFVSKDKLRVVCKPCHKTITAEGRKK